MHCILLCDQTLLYVFVYSMAHMGIIPVSAVCTLPGGALPGGALPSGAQLGGALPGGALLPRVRGRMGLLRRRFTLRAAVFVARLSHRLVRWIALVVLKQFKWSLQTILC